MKHSLFVLIAMAATMLVSTNECHTQAWDTPLSDYQMEKADLIIVVRITDKIFMTERGIYTCEVLKVKKGQCKAKEIHLDLELIAPDMEIYNRRFKALENTSMVTLGLKKDNTLLKIIEIDQLSYAFFMAE